MWLQAVEILLTAVKTNRNVFILHSLKRKQRLAAAAAAVWSAASDARGHVSSSLSTFLSESEMTAAAAEVAILCS